MIDLMQQFLWLPGTLAEVAVDAETITKATSAAQETLFSIQGVFTLGMLVLLQAVLGFDNLLYISIESKRVEESEQSKVRKLGIGLAIFFRIGLLFVVVNLVKALDESFYDIESKFISANVSGHSLIVLAGGAFILWTALKEIYHLIAIHDLDHEGEQGRETPLEKRLR